MVKNFVKYGNPMHRTKNLQIREFFQEKTSAIRLMSPSEINRNRGGVNKSVDLSQYK